MENYTIDKINEMIEILKKREDNQEYNIKSVKKTNIKDKTLNAYKFKTLFKNVRSSKILSYVIYELYIEGIINDTVLLNKLGYSINENKELINIDGTVISKDKINKEFALYYKNKLINSNKDIDGVFDKDYKDDRYKTMLLKIKLENSKKELYGSTVTNKSNNEDMYKGMGKC